MLPTFKKIEDWEGGEDEFRGAGGPIKVRKQVNLTPAAKTFLDTVPARLGVPVLDDYNGKSQEASASSRSARPRAGATPPRRATSAAHRRTCVC